MTLFLAFRMLIKCQFYCNFTFGESIFKTSNLNWKCFQKNMEWFMFLNHWMQSMDYSQRNTKHNKSRNEWIHHHFNEFSRTSKSLYCCTNSHNLLINSSNWFITQISKWTDWNWFQAWLFQWNWMLQRNQIDLQMKKMMKLFMK